jgi:hypothetical protein
VALLSDTIEALIAEQAAFVAWWSANVTPGQNPGRAGNKSRAKSGAIPMTDAEAQTGITKQQVSRWRFAPSAKAPTEP